MATRGAPLECSRSSPDDVTLLAHSAAATLRRRAVVGIFLAAGSQLGWGLYPVFARALQTQQPGLSTLELLIALNALSALALLLIAVLKLTIRQLRWLFSSVHVAKAAAAKASFSTPAATAATSCVARFLQARPKLTVGIFSVVIAARAISNVASAAFAPAHWLVMISLTTPFFTAGFGRFVFGEPLPPGTLPALLCGLCGSALAIWGGRVGDASNDERSEARVAEGDAHPASEGGSASSLLIGVGLAFLSTIALAMYQHLVQLTKGFLSESKVLTLNYAVVLVPCVAIASVEAARGQADPLASLGALGVKQWAYLLVFALVVYVLSNLAQQLAIRALGPTLIAAVMPLRLVSSVAGSYIVLSEAVNSPAEACGLLLVAVTAAAYLWNRVRTSARAAGVQSRRARIGAEHSERCGPASAEAASAGDVERLRSDDLRHVVMSTSHCKKGTVTAAVRTMAAADLDDAFSVERAGPEEDE